MAERYGYPSRLPSSPVTNRFAGTALPPTETCSDVLHMEGRHVWWWTSDIRYR
jgi:hypothetical protein